MEQPGEQQVVESPSGYRVPLAVAGGPTPAAAVEGLFALDEPCGTCIMSTAPGIAALAAPRGWRDPVLPEISRRLQQAHNGVHITTPPSLVRGFASRRGDWIEVSLGSRGDRLSTVILARELFDSEMLFAYANLNRPLRTGDRPAIAIGLWSHFSRSWERIGSQLGDERTGLAAEIALGVVVRRYYVTASLNGMTIALATPDPIVAEIAGRALLRLRSAHLDDMMVTPWEEPLVQRASELRLGVQTSDDISLTVRWRGPARDRAAFQSLIQEFADLLAIPGVAHSS